MRQAVVIGAGGGIGAALVAALDASGKYAAVNALSRRPAPSRGGIIDLADPDSIAAAAAAIDGPIDLVLVATGLLHTSARGPERSLKALDAEWLMEQYRINTVGPALVLRHFAPRLPKDRRAGVACLSARVGSISDNRLGGWYGYRAAKAALNQVIRTASIEIARTHPHALCVGLHPGTVATGLSAPFRKGAAAETLFTPAFAAERLLAVLDGLGPADSGGLFAWDGTRIAP